MVKLEAAVPLPLAATVMLIRDRPGGFQVLMLERPSNATTFAGFWVFPGGVVDPDDGDPTDPRTMRRAAVRETWEETGLVLDVEALIQVSQWIPPVGTAMGKDTFFFLATAPEGDVVIPPHELVGHRWMTPDSALRAHARGLFPLAPPTWIALHSLIRHGSVSEALIRTAARPVENFITLKVSTAGGTVLLWPGDAAYDTDADIHASGSRHRLKMSGDGWIYERSSDRHAL